MIKNRAGKIPGLLAMLALVPGPRKQDRQVNLFAAMLHEDKAVIAQHRLPDDATETTRVRDLLENVDLDDAVVTADAAHCQG